jgi:ADP-heptose:LPS heptosyltransferase
MKIKIIRALDYWCGVPLCFCFSLFHGLKRFFGFSRAVPSETKSIALVKLSELGALVLAYPLISRIRQKYPKAEVFFITLSESKTMLQLLEVGIREENILVIRHTSLLAFLIDTVRVVSRMRALRIDVIIDLEFFSRFTAVLGYVGGGRKRAGFHRYSFEGLYRGNLLTHRVQYNPYLHLAKNYLSFAEVISQEGKVTPELSNALPEDVLLLPHYRSSAERKAALMDKLSSAGIQGWEKLFLIHPGEGLLPQREWPVDNFIALTRTLLEEEGVSVVLIGTGISLRKDEMIIKEVNSPRCKSLVGKTTLEELCELFLLADAFIATDCGLVHLAALTPLKTFVLFGPESPVVFGPLGNNCEVVYSQWPCSPCLSAFNHRHSACRENKCLQVIKPEVVYQRIRSRNGN